MRLLWTELMWDIRPASSSTFKPTSKEPCSYRSPKFTLLWTSHTQYSVPASQREVSLIHLATDQPALPSPQAFHPSRGTPGRDLVGLLASPALPGSAQRLHPDR